MMYSIKELQEKLVNSANPSEQKRVYSRIYRYVVRALKRKRFSGLFFLPLRRLLPRQLRSYSRFVGWRKTNVNAILYPDLFVGKSGMTISEHAYQGYCTFDGSSQTYLTYSANGRLESNVPIIIQEINGKKILIRKNIPVDNKDYRE